MASEKPSEKYSTAKHDATRYLCLSSSLPMSQLSALADKIPHLFAFLSSTTPPSYPVGPPLFRYVAIPVGMHDQQNFDMEVGLPISSDFQMPEWSDLAEGKDVGEFEVKTLPGGEYLETTHIGPPGGLQAATKGLLVYAEQQGYLFDVQKSDEGSLAERDQGGDGEVETKVKDVWAARIEWYESDPKVVDVAEWRTRLSFKLK